MESFRAHRSDSPVPWRFFGRNSGR